MSVELIFMQVVVAVQVKLVHQQGLAVMAAVVAVLVYQAQHKPAQQTQAVVVVVQVIALATQVKAVDLELLLLAT
jgi:hypothetical protein